MVYFLLINGENDELVLGFAQKAIELCWHFFSLARKLPHKMRNYHVFLTPRSYFKLEQLSSAKTAPNWATKIAHRKQDNLLRNEINGGKIRLGGTLFFLHRGGLEIKGKLWRK